jgi:nicotinamide-nucleotide amidase
VNGAAEQTVAACRARGLTVATAESLTGGLVCAALTDVPGASEVVRGGVVTYVSAVKESLLGVPAGLLAEHGAVSEQTARLMAASVAALLSADCGVSTTGVAGPDDSEGHPPGTVHIAVHRRLRSGEERQVHRALTLSGTRSGIRRATVAEALGLLLQGVTRD